MFALKCPIVLLAAASASIAGAQTLATVSNFDGNFKWFKLADLPKATYKSMAHAKTITVVVSFSHPVKLKKDKNGNTWFSFVLADQAGDSKWHQTSGSGAIPLTGGMVTAGKHTVSIPLAGIAPSVFADGKQSLFLGPASSGLVGHTTFTVDAVRG